MEKYLSLIQQSAFFNGFTLEEMKRALKCLQGQVITYTKKEWVQYAEDIGHGIAILLEGSVYLSKTTIHGERQIYSERGTGELFGENCLWADNLVNGFDVEAVETSVILFIERDNILHPERTTCPLRQRIIENLFHLLLNNNQGLYQKVDLFAQKKLQERILFYLQLQARKNNSSSFTIPFSRQELAEYLNVDRSSLSRELAKMKADQLIDYHRQSFVLLQ